MPLSLPAPVRRTSLVPLRILRLEPVLRAIEIRAGHQYRDLRIEVIDGLGVVLHGEATSFHAKQLAQCVVTRLTGAAILANRIEVRPPTR